MPRSPKLRTRAEVIAALRHAVNRHAAEDAKCAAHPWGTSEHTEAHTLRCIWQGQVQAYRFVLRLAGGEPEPRE